MLGLDILSCIVLIAFIGFAKLHLKRIYYQKREDDLKELVDALNKVKYSKKYVKAVVGPFGCFIKYIFTVVLLLIS